MQKEFSTSIYGMLPSGLPETGALASLALDMRWSWNHEADELWQQLDPALWELTHNPWIVLQTVSTDQLERQLADPAFRNKIDELIRLKELSSIGEGWFQEAHPNSLLSCTAYFSMEYMLSEALPIYAGGLGNVAGDQLKSASDLNVPVVAIGLLYSQGYFRQQIDKNGSQLALFPYNDPGQLPITPLRLPNGEWLRIKVALPGYPVWLRTWQVQVGKCRLYLLDSNDAANLPWHRGITNEIYGGGVESRIKQEIVLGIGGWKLLRALGIHPEVCHLNEGHSAFVVLERAADFMKANNISFNEALEVTRAGNIFTTHTAVAAGFDHFTPQLMEQYFGAYAREALNISIQELMALGRQNPGDASESFSMVCLAIRGCGAVNGVSRLHATVSQHLFQPLFEKWPAVEVPVGSITNGVHMPSWDSEFADEVWTNACGKDRWKGDLDKLQEKIMCVPAETLWRMRNQSRALLVEYVRKRYERQVSVSGQSMLTEAARHVFDPETLTLGFARRFVSYKRPTLLLHDEERFHKILTRTGYPVQLIIAGKAPPYDEAGKSLIRKWMDFIAKYNLYKEVVFLSDYDVLLTEHMVQGVDVWINTPLRPWEACGTSGMKVLVNGGINLSELDGWWAEAYSPEVGWAIGDMQEHGEDPGWEAAEADALYRALENEIIPEFYNRTADGVPLQWTEKISHSMASLTPRYSANRTVREYVEKYYLPAAEKYLHRSGDHCCTGKRIIKAKNDLNIKWNGIHFSEVKMDKTETGYNFSATIFLNGINHEHIQVELYANPENDRSAERIPMFLETSLKEGQTFKAQVKTERPADDYTVRIIPRYENIQVPLENNLIAWQR